MGFRILALCLPPNIWPEVLPNGAGTLWRGGTLGYLIAIARMVGIPDEDIELVSDVPREDPNYKRIHSPVINGLVDTAPIGNVISHSRYQNFDFAMLDTASEVVIISRRKDDVMSGNFLSEMFDWWTYGLFTLTFILSALCLVVMLKMSFGNALLASFQLIFDKGISQKYFRTIQSKVILGTVAMASVVPISCFASLITAKLLIAMPGKNIDSFEDLSLQPNLEVIVWQNSFFHRYAVSVKERGFFKNKINPRKNLFSPSIYKKVNITAPKISFRSLLFSRPLKMCTREPLSFCQGILTIPTPAFVQE